MAIYVVNNAVFVEDPLPANKSGKRTLKEFALDTVSRSYEGRAKLVEVATSECWAGNFEVLKRGKVQEYFLVFVSYWKPKLSKTATRAEQDTHAALCKGDRFYKVVCKGTDDYYLIRADLTKQEALDAFVGVQDLMTQRHLQTVGFLMD